MVKPGVDEDLDNVKRTLAGIDSLLDRAAENIGASIPPQYTRVLEVSYIPQLGYLIAMPIDPVTRRAHFEGGEGDDAWHRFFSTSDKIFFKDTRMQELDETFGDLQNTIYGMILFRIPSVLLRSEGREIDLVYELGERVLQHEMALCKVSEILGELDRHVAPVRDLTGADDCSLLALAQGARLYKLKKPQVTYQNIIQIRGGRCDILVHAFHC